MNLSFVIPIFNEEKNIENLVNEIIVSINKISVEYEIILVNDASQDGTSNKIKYLKSKFPNKIILINNVYNEGQSYSIVKGINKAKFDTIVTLDGDGQNDPADLPKLINKYFEDPMIKFVAGIRADRKDNYIKIITSKIANNFRKFILKDNCIDSGCALRIFEKKIFLKLPKFRGLHRFLPALFKSFKIKTEFINVNHRKRLFGNSNYGTFRRLIYGIIDIIRVLYIINKIKNDRLP